MQAKFKQETISFWGQRVLQYIHFPFNKYLINLNILPHHMPQKSEVVSSETQAIFSALQRKNLVLPQDCLIQINNMLERQQAELRGPIAKIILDVLVFSKLPTSFVLESFQSLDGLKTFAEKHHNDLYGAWCKSLEEKTSGSFAENQAARELKVALFSMIFLGRHQVCAFEVLEQIAQLSKRELSSAKTDQAQSPEVAPPPADMSDEEHKNLIRMFLGQMKAASAGAYNQTDVLKKNWGNLNKEERINSLRMIGQSGSEYKKANQAIINLPEKEELRFLRSAVSQAAHTINNQLNVALLRVSMLVTVLERNGDAPADKVEGYFTDLLKCLGVVFHKLQDEAYLQKLLSHPEQFLLPNEHKDINQVLKTLVARGTATNLVGTQVSYTYAQEPLQLVLNSVSMSSIMTNLINNALRYVEPGEKVSIKDGVETRVPRGVRVSIQRVQRPIKGVITDCAMLEVDDDGPGIDPDLHERIFEPKYRGPKSMAIGGTGMGLGIVKTAVQLHGGEITLISDVGQGAKFQCFFPLSEKSVK